SPDGRTYTFHLRGGVKAANGDAMTAQDLKYTFDREFGTKAVGAYIMGVANIPSPDAVVVVDPQTLRITLPGPDPIFLRVMYVFTNSGWDQKVVQQHATATDTWAEDWLKQNAAGFGPYHIQEFKPGSQVVFGRNPNYYGKRPYFDQVIYREIPDSSQRLG